MPPAGPPHARPPAWWTRGLVELAAAPLPAAARDRYLREFLADLHGLSRAERASYAVHVIGCALPLRLAVRSGNRGSPWEGIDMTTRKRRPLRCGLNIRHDWVGESAADGARYLRCRRCGKDETGKPNESTGFQAAHGANMLGGGGFGI